MPEQYAYQRRKNYCNSDCQHKSLIKEKEKRTCKTCGKEFYIVKENKNTKNKKYCSLKCSYESKKEGKTLTCPICGKEFYRKKTSINNRKTLACSVSCSAQITMNMYRTSSQEKLTKLFEKFLNENATREATFNDFKNKRNLRIDAIFNNNKIAIEFNGKQHYTKDHGFNYNINLNEGIKTDNKKIKYLLDNDYSVIEWPYFTPISNSNVEFVLGQLANQQPSQSATYFIAERKVQRLDGNDQKITDDHPRVLDILNLRDDDIVRSWIPVK